MAFASQVAEWARRSVEILLKIYAKCLDGGGEILRRVQTALGHGQVKTTAVNRLGRAAQVNPAA